MTAFGGGADPRSAAPDPARDHGGAVRRALVDAALAAYEAAGLSGLCAEGRWEAAVSALRVLDLRRVVRPPGRAPPRPGYHADAHRVAAP